MTQLAHQPLQRLKDRLAKSVAEGDAAHLAELLRGRHLPALGGSQASADLLLQALNLHPYDPDLADGVAALNGQVLADHAARVTSDAADREKAWDYGAQTLVYNGLLLACDLPANETLSDAVKNWHHLLVERGLEASDYPQLPTIGRQALIHQQTDDSLESYWLTLIDRVGSAAHGEDQQKGLTSEERTLLLDAWRGLLWIPPDQQLRDVRGLISVIYFDRLNRGLLHLESALTERVEQEAAVGVLRRVLRILQQAYPRSSRFWLESFAPFCDAWGDALLNAAREVWPTAETKVSTPPDDAGTISQEILDLERATRAFQEALKSFEARAEASHYDSIELYRYLVKKGRVSHPQEIEKASEVVSTLSSAISQFLNQARKVRNPDDEEEGLLAG